jgi:23S rRNA pseudouridine1911/1915/1917 synthase
VTPVARASAPAIVPVDLDGVRLDRAIAELFELSTNAARRLCESNRVRVDKKRAKKGDRVRAGQTIDVEGGGRWLVPSPIEIAVLHEDDDALIVDKPAGVSSHPLVPGEGGTVVDALVARYPEIADASDDPREGGLLHRLDTGTSGCLALARNKSAWRELRASFVDVEKRYLAIVHNEMLSTIRIQAPIDHDPKDARRMITGQGRDALTTANPVVTTKDHSVVIVEIEGGRRHQIRVHLAHAGYPLVGDTLYGAPPADDTAWPLLHALSITLPRRPSIRAPIPSVFMQATRTRGLALEAARL